MQCTCLVHAQEQVSSSRQSEGRTVAAARTRGGDGHGGRSSDLPPAGVAPCGARQSRAEKVLLYMSSKFLVPLYPRRQLDLVAAIC